MIADMFRAVRVLRSTRSMIFDCDGTLIDSEGIHVSALQIVLASVGVEIDIATLHARFTGVDNPSILRKVSAESGIDFPPGLAAKVSSAAYRLIARDAKPMPGAIEVVRDLAESGVRLAVASNSTYRNVEAMLARASLDTYFGRHIATRDRVKSPKPAPDVYFLAAELLAVAPFDCAAVEDSPAGVESARAAGMSVIGYCPPGSRIPATALIDAGVGEIIQDLRLLLQ
jgi:HAD superfamily hydrolase (TIGR01509 family)